MHDVQGLCWLTSSEEVPLVYDHVNLCARSFPSSSFHSLVLSGQSRPPLNWTERLHIAIGTARALSYLHEEISLPFIHRDVKVTVTLRLHLVVTRALSYQHREISLPSIHGDVKLTVTLT